jgi:hypothetical protein
MASLYAERKPPGSLGAAALYIPAGSGNVDVVNDYTWTLTPKKGRKEIPTIRLTEFEVNESTITRQIDFYTTGTARGIGIGGAATDILSPYDELFPKDKDTKFVYTFPFYSDINFELNTPTWTSIDTLEAAKGVASETASMIHPFLGEAVDKGINLAAGVTGAVLAARYPKVGIMDRPKLWSHHEFRSYTVTFPLYNTINNDSNNPEWIKNRELCELLINQNLFNKLSWITGIPPVFYEVLIPGQHYAYAACVTNISVYNRGNLRQLSMTGGALVNVPDVYEVNITLTDLVVPSKNQFQAINNETVRTNSRNRGLVTTPPPTEPTPGVPSPGPSPLPGVPPLPPVIVDPPPLD